MINLLIIINNYSINDNYNYHSLLIIIPELLFPFMPRIKMKMRLNLVI